MAEETVKHKIKANVFSIENGHVQFENVKAVRIISDKYNILIMEDFLPVIGEVKGNVSIVLDDSTEEFNNITGYYKHSHNQFELLIKGYDNVA